ncbi:MAG: lytic transglycosylase domain-containing protein [Gammaproteobacteria bacterium]|nr:lytic transglycosylase domain-containing protein [Gammaproteobacteria bacterium]
MNRLALVFVGPLLAISLTVQAEGTQAVPLELLRAMALTESGAQIGEAYRPWPWTLNVRGRGMRFGSRENAWRALTRLLAANVTNIDIGAMQVNWHWHNKKLGSPWEALEPGNNLRVAHSILTSELQRTGDLWKAVGAYHSYDPNRADAYVRRVARNVLRIRAARDRSEDLS